MIHSDLDPGTRPIGFPSRLAPTKPAVLLAPVKAHARDHYETEGWDFVVEAFDDEQLARMIGEATNVVDAIAHVRAIVTLHDERRREVRGLATAAPPAP